MLFRQTMYDFAGEKKMNIELQRDHFEELKN